MQMIHFLVLTLVFAASLGALSLYFWRRSTSLYTLLLEGASRYEEMRRRASALESTNKDQEAKVRDFHQKALAADKNAQEALKRAETLVQELEDKKTEVLYVTDKLERQKGYLEGVVTKQTSELEGLKAERQRLTEEMTESQKAWSLKLEHQRRQAQEELRTSQGDLEKVRERLSQLEGEQQELAKKASEGDPAELKRLKRKTAQYARLYVAMRGLKEMAEERSHNWEVGLLKFATWIIQQNQGSKAVVPKEIGPCVGLAMKMIGQQLVDDDEHTAYHFEGKSHPRDPSGIGEVGYLASQEPVSVDRGGVPSGSTKNPTKTNSGTSDRGWKESSGAGTEPSPLPSGASQP